MSKKIILMLLLIVSIISLNGCLFVHGPYYSKQKMFEMAENKLNKFLELYPKYQDTEVVKKSHLRINYINCDTLPKNFISYEIVKNSIKKRDLTDDYVVFNYEAKVILNYAPKLVEYYFIVRFESTILSYSNEIPKAEAENDVWAIRWRKIK